MIPRFSCGHYRVTENMVGNTQKRCRACAEHYQYNELMRRVDARRPLDKNSVLGEPILGDDIRPAIERASHKLLSAIYREHPYVFDAAEKHGRYCQRP